MIGISILNYRTAPVCILLSLVLVGCDLNFQEKKITGTVFDNFGKPIENARVSIKNSSFSALTDESGAFRLEYVPGTFTVLLFAEGHTSRSVQLTIQEATSYPLDDTLLYRIPPGDGLHLVGANGYVPLFPCAISKRELKSPGFMSSAFEYRVAMKNLDEDAVHSVTEALADLELGDQKSRRISVADSTPANFKLVILDDGNRIGTTSFGPMSGNQNNTVLPEKFINLDGFAIRKISNLKAMLKDGAVACYVQFGKTMMGQEAILDSMPAYCFAKSIEMLPVQLGNSRIQEVRTEPMPDNIVQEPRLTTNPPKKSADSESKYRSQIISKVTSNWFRPKSTRAGMRCMVTIVQIPGGEIISTRVGSVCNADEETRKSIIAAIEGTKTLPYVGFEEVFAREINLDFKYDGN